MWASGAWCSEKPPIFFLCFFLLNSFIELLFWCVSSPRVGQSSVGSAARCQCRHIRTKLLTCRRVLGRSESGEEVSSMGRQHLKKKKFMSFQLCFLSSVVAQQRTGPTAPVHSCPSMVSPPSGVAPAALPQGLFGQQPCKAPQGLGDSRTFFPSQNMLFFFFFQKKHSCCFQTAMLPSPLWAQCLNGSCS